MSEYEHKTEDFQPLMDRLRKILEDEHTTPLALGYFERTAEGLPSFTGSSFDDPEVFGENVPEAFTAADLVAVTTLNVSVPAYESVRILGEDASTLTDLLRQIPVASSPDSDEGRRMLMDPKSAAQSLWKKLEDRKGIGWVTAGKLCARKRPELLPVFDGVVKEAMDPPGRKWWEAVAHIFQNPDLRGMAERLSAELSRGAGHQISPLRSLDIAIWMRQYGYRWSPNRGAIKPLNLS